VAKITTSAGIRVPSAKVIWLTRPSWADSFAVAVDVRTVTPSPAMIRRSASPPPSSTCNGISRGANSTTVVSTPSAVSAPAASRPSRPPPITAPRTGRSSLARRSSTKPRRAATSSIVRYTKHPGMSAPLTGGTAGYDPVARTSWS